jgi:hypothetical protein
MTGPPHKASTRDEATLLRLRRRMGQDGLIRYIQLLADEKAVPKRSGAPRMKRTRQGLLGALYLFSECQRHSTISEFASRLPGIVEIKYSRRIPPVYTVYKTPAALEADLRRGLRGDSEHDRRRMIDSLLFWRFVHVNPLWGFGCGSNPHLLISPKKPSRIIGWIDAAIKRSGVPEDAVRRRFQPQRIKTLTT